MAFFNMFPAPLLALLVSLGLLTAPAYAVSLDGLMQNDSASKKKQANKTKQDRGRNMERPGTLGELMYNPKAKKSNTTIRPSLGNVEADRLARKKKLALNAYQNARNDINRRCSCLSSGGCEKKASGSWIKSGRYIHLEREAIKRKQKACANAPRVSISESSSLERIQKYQALASSSSSALSKIDAQMSSDSSADWWDGRRRAEQAKKEREEAIAAAEWRKLQEWSAQVDREQEKAWANSKSQDDEFWGNIKKTERQTMDKINANRSRMQKSRASSSSRSNGSSSSWTTANQNSDRGKKNTGDSSDGPKSGYQVGIGNTEGAAHDAAVKKLDSKWSCGLKKVPSGNYVTTTTKTTGGWKVKISYACGEERMAYSR